MTVREILRSKTLLLIIIVFLIAIPLNFIPHYSYEYPVHGDEWGIYKGINDLIKNDKIEIFSINEKTKSVRIVNYESAYIIFLSIFKIITNIPTVSLSKFLPSILFAIAVISVYIFGKRDGYGLEAAFLTALFPTTVNFLGPGFTVAVALSIIFIPLCLFMINYVSGPRAYVLISIIVIFLLLAHPLTMLGVLIVTTPFLLLKSRVEKLYFAIIGVLVLLLSLQLGLSSLIIPTMKTWFDATFSAGVIKWTHYDFGQISILSFGVHIVLLYLAGILFLIKRGKKKDYLLTEVSMLLLLLILLYYRFGLGPTLLYYRSLIFTFTIMCIIGGYGLKEIFSGIKTRWKPVIILIVICALLIYSTYIHINTPYYYMVTDEEYRDYEWIAQHFTEGNRIAMDPWKVFTLTMMANVSPYAVREWYPEKNNRVINFLRNESKDTSFLKKNNISIVYTKSNVNNNELHKIGKSIYVYNK